jgi:hypothetical protein
MLLVSMNSTTLRGAVGAPLRLRKPLKTSDGRVGFMGSSFVRTEIRFYPYIVARLSKRGSNL